MKKRIPYFLVFAWMIIVVAMTFADSFIWSGRRAVSVCQDGCASGDLFYVVENTGDEGILYALDERGNVREVCAASSIWRGSAFGLVDYRDGLYAVLENEAAASADGGGTEQGKAYMIVRLDEKCRLVAASPEIYMEQPGVLTGFWAEEDGFYLTLVMDGGEAAGAYFMEKDRLLENSGMQALEAEEGEETESAPLYLQLQELVSCEQGRFFIEAEYADRDFLLCRDDGSGTELFAAPEGMEAAFYQRRLSAGQLMKLRRGRLVLYIELLFAGYVALPLLYMALRNRKHTVYTIVIVETALFLITLAGALGVPYVQEAAQEEEAERFGLAYIRAIADNISGTLGRLDFDGGDFYTGSEYYSLQEQLSGFAASGTISEIFTDVCLVRSSDHQILVSVSGCNGQAFESVYGMKTGELIAAISQGDKDSLVICMGGASYQILGCAASEELHPEYLLLGIVSKAETSGIISRENMPYLIYAGAVFLICSLLIIFLLLWQGRELKYLSRAMQTLALGKTDIRKQGVQGTDVGFMWNSLMEIKRIISRINYTRYRIFESCYRFAPKNIEKIMGKDSITEVKDGDTVQLRGTVAVVTSREPEVTGGEPVDVINRFISLVAEHQEENGGFFVSGYSDLTSLKVLFLESTADTTAFGVSLMRRFYEEKSLKALKTGILLHYSRYVYGVAGTDTQSFPFLLSKEIRELENYAVWFRDMGLRLVVTEPVKEREALSGGLRYIGYAYVSASREKLNMYEALDACPVYERRLKLETDASFQKALQLFYQHDFYLARSTFSDVLKENQEDSMARWYLFVCEKYLNESHFEGDICRLHWDN